MYNFFILLKKSCISNFLAANLKRIFQRAAIHIADQTCINFVPRTNERDYVRVIRDNGCYSYVGRIGGPQKMSLPAVCQRFGTFVHEMLHAVGFRHEQARFDRDRYVKIVWENIPPANRHNFVKHPMRLGTRYDYYSVMHYSGNAFSRNGKATIVPKWGGAFIGQRDGMSKGDAAEVNKKFCQ